MKKLSNIWRWILGVALVFLILIITIVTWTYTHLSVGEAPRHADVIVMIEGGDVSRYKMTAELYKRGYADKVIVSPAIEDANGLNNVEALIAEGIPEQDIIKEKGPTTSTWQNAVHSIALMKEKNFHSALIVTSDYHTARAKLAFERADDADMTFRLIGTLDKDGASWNETETGKVQARREMIALPIYWLGLYKFKFFDR